MTQLMLMPDRPATTSVKPGRECVKAPQTSTGSNGPLDREEVDEAAGRIRAAIAGPGQARVRSEAGTVRPLVITQDSAGYLCREGAPPVFEISLDGQGQVQTRMHGRQVNMRLQCPKCEEDLVDIFGADLMDTALAAVGKDTMALAMGPWDSASALYISARHVAMKIIDEITTASELPAGWAEPAESPRRGREANRRATLDRAIREMLDAGIMKRARNQKRVAPTAEQYNAALAGREPEERTRTGEYRRATHHVDMNELRRITEAASRNLTGWRAVEFQEQAAGAATLSIMRCSDWEPAATFRRHTDGTITLDGLGTGARRMNYRHTDYAAAARDRAATEIYREILGGPEPTGHLLFAGTESGVHRTIREAASRVVEETAVPPIMPKGSRTKQVPPDQVGPLVTRLVREKLADRQTVKNTVRAIGGRQGNWGVAQYNNMAMNGDLFERMREPEASVVKYYMETIFPSDEEPVRMSGGDLIQSVRMDLGLTGGPWRWFRRLQGRWGMHRARRRDIAPTCRLLHEANRPNADTDLITIVAYRTYETSRIEDDDLRPNLWAHWVRAINRLLAMERGDHGQTNRDLQHVYDAMRARPQGDWNAPDWPAMVARAERYLERRAEARARGLSWESAIQTTEIDGLIFNPLTTSAQLQEWGTRLNNCLANYDQRCNAGEDRVFTITDQDQEPVGAVQLSRTGGRWRPVQTEGPGRKELTAQAETACETLATLYEAADRTGLDDDD